MESEINKIKQTLENYEKRISALEEILKKKPRRILREIKSIEDLLIELKSDGFFKEAKTISQIRDALHAKGRIVELTTLPSYLLKLVQTEDLKREQRIVENRKIWVYFT